MIAWPGTACEDGPICVVVWSGSACLAAVNIGLFCMPEDR